MFNSSNFNQNDFNSYKHVRAPKPKKFVVKRRNVRLVELRFKVIGDKKLLVYLDLTLIGLKKQVVSVYATITGSVIENVKKLLFTTGSISSIISGKYITDSKRLLNIKKHISINGKKLHNASRLITIKSKLLKNTELESTVSALKKLSVSKKYSTLGKKNNIVNSINKISGNKIKYNIKDINLKGKRDKRRVILSLMNIE